MLLRFAIILVIICLLWRWASGSWPWEMLRARSESAPSRAKMLREARKLLNVERGASREEIVAAHKRLIATVHPDRGGTSAEVHEANDARDLLLDNLPLESQSRE